ncbi:MAG: EscG/YscG/SsaH family type III secretion system needle protein co-chaperone [Candidatus Symbiodolus clandestinus]
MIIDQPTRQLVVSIAFAAINHGLLRQAEEIAAAFPDLIVDAENRALCQALLLFGLKQPTAAWRSLSQCCSTEADQLRQLIGQVEPTLAEKRSHH